MTTEAATTTETTWRVAFHDGKVILIAARDYEVTLEGDVVFRSHDEQGNWLKSCTLARGGWQYVEAAGQDS